MIRIRFTSFIAVLVFPLFAFGQAPLTADQLQLLQNLSPADQAALFDAVRSGNPGTAIGQSAAPAFPGSPDTGVLDESIELQARLEEFLEAQRVKGGDTIVVTATLKEDAEPSELNEFLSDIYRGRVVGSHALEVDKNGVLDLPGIASIPLAGLSAEEVAIRLSSEPLLAVLNIEVTILPLIPTGTDALQPYGYEIFDSEDDVFRMQKTEFIPVPRDYVIGPGDIIRVQLYGEENYEVDLAVNQDGTINFPRAGPQSVAGLTFGELKDQIEQRVSDQLIGTQAAVALADMRSIGVFVVGDVKRPGAYMVSGLSRITNALFASGGITEVGSLRKVELKRNGRLIKKLDLYDLLLHGDTSQDVQLQSGDVVLIPPSSMLVGIDGEVRRPAIYELVSERTAEQLMELAGGLLPTADRVSIQLERVTDAGLRRVETLDLADPESLSMILKAGDLIRVFPVLDEIDDAVFLRGHVTRPGSYEWSPGMRITDLLPSEVYLKPKADLDYVMIRRERGPDRQIIMLSADLKAAQAAPGSANDIVLQKRDHITVFELGVARSVAIKAILLELDAQSTTDSPLQAAKITGQVRAPGTYPLESGMRVSDLLRAGGGLKASAFAREAELTRYVLTANGGRQTELIHLDLNALRRGESDADILLAPYDYLNIKEIPEWAEQFEVQVLGEVVFPGTYPVTRGETLSSVVKRAGGLSDQAFPQGSVFSRQTLKEREAQQLEVLASRLEADLTALALQASTVPGGASGSQRALSIGQSLLEQLRTSTPTGRLVIDLPTVIQAEGDPATDIVLKDGDMLLVPTLAQEIMVLGEVQYSTSHLFNPDLARDRYINMSGGMTPNADSRRVYVVRANGAVVVSGRSRWFRGGGTAIKSGDTIVVPLDTDRVPQMAQWASITQIIFNLAIAVAAVNSF